MFMNQGGHLTDGAAGGMGRRSRNKRGEKCAPSQMSKVLLKFLLFKHSMGGCGVAQVVEDMPSHCKALRSNPRTAKINKISKQTNLQ
jgi:hypothetical protein